jgi:CRISPR-associated protein Cas1
MAQALLLREHDYTSSHGYIYYAGSRRKTRIDFTPELETETRDIITAVRAGRDAIESPPPLEDSPKCWGCSLCGICLPDETRALQAAAEDPTSEPVGKDVRRLYPARDRATPFYVQEQGAKVGKSGERLNVTKKKEKLGSARLTEVSHLVLMGNVQVSTQALHLLMGKGVPVIHFSTGGWLHGISHGNEVENAYGRAAQYQAAADPARCRAFAAEVVRAKVANQRILIQRNAREADGRAVVADLARQMKTFSPDNFSDLDTLRGWEGQAAARYFSVFNDMLKVGQLPEFLFTHRNRRPPKDPVNALLSFAYALLAKECTGALLGEGLDPWWGLYHQPRHGRPALALDLMEPFRPIIADSTVITAINTGMVSPTDFIINSNGCALLPKGRKAFLRAWESRLDQLYTHPLFDYRCSWRTMIRIQARLLVRWLKNDIPEWICPVVR